MEQWKALKLYPHHYLSTWSTSVELSIINSQKRRLEKIVLKLADQTHLSAIATELHILAALTPVRSKSPLSTIVSALTVVLHALSEYCFCEMPSYRPVHTTLHHCLHRNTEIKLFSIFSEKKGVFLSTLPREYANGKGLHFTVHPLSRPYTDTI